MPSRGKDLEGVGPRKKRSNLKREENYGEDNKNPTINCRPLGKRKKRGNLPGVF